VARIARAHGVDANLVFNWRRLYQAGRLVSSRAKLLPVRVTADELTTASFPTSLPASRGRIHMQLQHVQVSIEGSVDPGMLRVLLECLQR
jgi:transposase